MKPLDQTQFGFPDGNCWATCVASLLEIEIDDVDDGGVDSDWYIRFLSWLNEKHGLGMFEIKLEKGAPRGYAPMVDGTLGILSGPSPRGPHLHACVGRYQLLSDGMHCINGVHDPHPDRTYFGDEHADTFTVFTATRPSSFSQTT